MKSILLLFLSICSFIPIAHAQMREPQDWLNYQDVFDLKNNQRQYDFDVICTKSSAPANIFWPGDPVSFDFQLINNTSKPIKTEGFIEVVHHGNKGIANDIWLPEMLKFASIEKINIAVDLVPYGFQDISVRPVLPETFGAYALVIDLGDAGRRLGTSLVKTFKPDHRRMQFPKQSLDDLGADFLYRIGVKAIRMGIPYIPTTHRDYQAEMEKLDARLRDYHAHHITVLPMFMEGPALIPLGTPRSFLDSTDTFLKTKQDYVWLPELDDDFSTFVKDLCMRHGWPKGCITGVHLWNEPWEGISISGWQSDMLRYREIYRAMADGVLEARKSGIDVLIGGCDSNSNAWDKLFSDGTMDFLPIFDFLSIHYQGMDAPSIYPEWINRKDYKGRVKIWDTESWVGNTDDRIGVVVATNRAAGYDRSMGIYGGYMISRPHEGQQVWSNIRSSEGTKRIEAVPNAWSPAAAMGAVQHMIGERDFNRLLFPKGLPWAMVFNGYFDNEDDGTVVVCGDIGEAFGADNVLFREVRSLTETIKKESLRKKLALLDQDSPERHEIIQQLDNNQPITDGTMTIKAADSFRLYDFYGNEIPPKGGIFSIPLTFKGYYLRTDGSKGSFAKLLHAIAHGNVSGYEPVEIIAHDPTNRMGNQASLELTISNILNHPVKGSLLVTLADLQLEYPQKLSLNAFETKTIHVKVMGGQGNEANSYPLTVHYNAGKDGLAVHYEDMHVNLIVHKTVNIDGRLDEWKGALPQIITSGVGSLSLTEAAWYPFKDFDKGAASTATGYLAYDDDYFYFAAKVADSSPHPGTYRFETRNDDEFFYPEKAYKTDNYQSSKKKEGQVDVSEADQRGLQIPGTSKRWLNFWEPDQNHTAIGVNIQIPEGKSADVSFYLPSLDVGRVDCEVFDRNTGMVLNNYQIDRLWDGAYVTYQLSGDVRVLFRGAWWYNVKLAGIFVDEIVETPSLGTTATYINLDVDQQGNWIGRYGKSGYWIFGKEKQLPEGFTIHASDSTILKELKWPQGVRRYTYRKDPVLPDNSSGLGFSTDNLQIAFNVVPLGEDGLLANPPGTMPRFTGYKCTDYEYALNQVSPAYGGGAEIWRLLVPGMPRKHFYPRQPSSPFDGPVRDGKLAISHEGNTRITECAIPWSELPDVKNALDNGQKIKFSFRVNDNTAIGNCTELARNRSVSKINSRAFHADWKEHWANEVEFSFEK